MNWVKLVAGNAVSLYRLYGLGGYRFVIPHLDGSGIPHSNLQGQHSKGDYLDDGLCPRKDLPW
jgi:hypothetical protein